MAVSPGMRWNVLQRDDFTCQYCGAKAPHVQLEVDHLIPQSKGGKDVLGNLVTACALCNGGKGARELLHRDESLLADFDYLIEHYTASPVDALGMLRAARNQALEKLMEDIDAAWQFTIFRAARIVPLSNFELCLLAAFYEKDFIYQALETVADEITRGVWPQNRHRLAERVMHRVGEYASKYQDEFYGTTGQNVQEG